MRIALLPDEYLPSGTRIHSKMFHELALQFKDSGHKPVVITPGSPSQDTRLVVDYFEGVEVWRFKSGSTRGVGLIQRAFNEFLLPLRAWYAIREKVKQDKFDLCVNYAPTIFFGPLVRIFKRQGTYVYLVLRDMFPQWIIDEGLIKEKSLAAYFFRFFESLNYKTSDCIGVQSQANLELFIKKFPNFNNVRILRNWSATSNLYKSSTSNTFRTQLNLMDKIIFFYGGNTGHAQDMENIMRLVRSFKDIGDAHFLIVGQGDEFELIQDLQLKWDLKNLTILPSIGQKEFTDLLSEIDIGLFSLSFNHTAHNFPGKLMGYMNASKPILGSVNPGNDLLDVINASQAGFVFINGQDVILQKAAEKLLNDEELRSRLGKNGRDLLIREFSVEKASAEILSAMKG